MVYTYPQGTDIGDPASLSALAASAGGPASAGPRIADGIVIGYADEGFPIMEPLSIVSASNAFSNPGAVAADRCAVLAGR